MLEASTKQGACRKEDVGEVLEDEEHAWGRSMICRRQLFSASAVSYYTRSAEASAGRADALFPRDRRFGKGVEQDTNRRD